MDGINFNVAQPDGSTLSVSPQRVAEDLTKMGVPAQVGPNGMDLHYQIDGQMLSMPITDILAEKVGKVTGMGFGGDGSFVDPELRFAIENLPNDATRKAYLQFALTSKGIESPQVFGMGSDWGFVDPGSGQVRPLTNVPGMDLSDIGQIGKEGVRFLGAALGGGLGATAAGLGSGGIASIPGAMLGAGAGSGTAQTMMQAYLAGTDPSYRQTIANTDTLGDIGTNIAKETTFDMAGAAIPGLAGAGLSKLFPKAAQALGPAPISKIVEKGSGIAEEGLKFASKTADLINTPLGRGVVSELGPGLGTAQLGGIVAQWPAAITRNSPKIANWFRSKFDMPLKPVADTIKPVEKFGESTARAFRRNFGGGGIDQYGVPERTSADVLGDAFEKLGRTIGKRREAKIAAEQPNLIGDLAEESARRGRAFGEGVGKTMEGVAAGGRALEGSIDWAMNMGLQGISKAAKGGSYVAGVPRLGAQFAAPLETRAWGYVPGRLSEEYFDYRGK